MKVEGAYTFPAPREQVWTLLLDPEALRGCIPGAESLTETGPDSWDAVLKVGVAAVRGTYKGKVSITDKQEPEKYTLNIEGSGGPGFVKGSAIITLTPDGDGTRVAVDGDGQVGGMIAGVAQRLIGGVSKMMMDQFFGCMAKKLES
jgi:carbon monoxide dehydrogenase subunit G